MQYQNPIYDRNFPDPSILKHAGMYWAYATGRWADGRCFGILRSADLVHWEEIGGALEPLADNWPHYWAPEVIYQNGQFLMYYSTGDELNTMHIRVAIAQSPAGPFIDSGRILTREPFAIDAHVFVDRDGSRHLFYATDYLTHSHIGTGTARDTLLDATTTAGQPAPVTRARYDWQVYDPQRAEKGGVRWHTIEGPFVLLHKQRYYQMFSAGNWQNPSYGVSYAIAERIDQSDEWSQVADGQQVLPILRTVPAPGGVIGPGHNSVVRGPDNRQLLCVYHRWDLAADARVMAIDKLDWVGERLVVLGPSTTTQLLLAPTFSDYFRSSQAPELGENWRCRGGRWQANDGAMQLDPMALAAARLHGAVYDNQSCLIELTLRVLNDPTGQGRLGIALGDKFQLLIVPGRRQAVIEIQQTLRAELALDEQFDPVANHLLRIECNARTITITIDDSPLHWEGIVDLDGPLELRADQIAACFTSIEITAGWEDLFSEPDVRPGDLGWQVPTPAPPDAQRGWQLHDQRLLGSGEHALITKGPLPGGYELVVNARLINSWGASYTLLPAMQGAEVGPRIALEQAGQQWILRCSVADHQQIIELPAAFDPYHDQQWRLQIANQRITIAWESLVLGELPCHGAADRIGLLVEQATAAFDMVRVTAIV